MSVSAVVVDGGEPTLERCLRSLRGQVDEIVVCPSSRSDLRVAKRYAEVVLEPEDRGMGRARVKGILRATGRYVLSADSDTVYSPAYARFAAEDLGMLNAVKAGTILPLEPSLEGHVECALMPVFGYEFSLAFRRDAFLSAGCHKDEGNYAHRLSDIGLPVVVKLLPLPDVRMVCFTRAPTRIGRVIAKDYWQSLLATGALLGGAVALPLANELSKVLRLTSF
jgi:glycosyltransferase involved in cell wall biosynthesis